MSDFINSRWCEGRPRHGGRNGFLGGEVGPDSEGLPIFGECRFFFCGMIALVRKRRREDDDGLTEKTVEGRL